MAALKTHCMDAGVIKFVITAIGNLCIVEYNNERLGSVGVCELLVEVAEAHMMDVDVVKATALTMGKLCEVIHRPVEQQQTEPSMTMMMMVSDDDDDIRAVE
jgi:hypothetical protein